jgi:hypothetical protein
MRANLPQEISDFPIAGYVTLLFLLGKIEKAFSKLEVTLPSSST